MLEILVTSSWLLLKNVQQLLLHRSQIVLASVAWRWLLLDSDGVYQLHIGEDGL